MKIVSFAAAALVSLSALAPVAAGAQERTVTTRTVTRSHTEERAPALRVHSRRSCTTHIDRGHRVRVCRTVRY